MLLTSDNDVAEALGHLVGAKATGAGTFDGGARASLAVLGELGVPVAGVRLLDASGLSRSNLIPPSTLTALLRTSASAEQPDLRGVLTGMPVARLSGSLDERFDGPATSTAAGEVRGKTGTLTGVSSLSGVVVDREGRQLAYAVLADDVPEGGNPQAEVAIDRLVARLAACGCA
jgi:D-alanyl-D-alanine carboxypeptidase/D-alanyl-D-alanine-endopeptidase (penicillin-binding protein 4)